MEHNFKVGDKVIISGTHGKYKNSVGVIIEIKKFIDTLATIDIGEDYNPKFYTYKLELLESKKSGFGKFLEKHNL